MSDHEDETTTAENAPPKNISQITTVTNISAKFPYLKKGEYDIWAMKMQNFISSSDLLCWNIVLKGNSAKSMTTDNDGNLKIRPPITAEEYQQVQREEKARTILLSAIPDEHIEEGLDKGYDKMQKILTKMNTLKIKPDPEDINIKFLRGLPFSWSGIALILKTKGGLEYISFDDLYNKLKFLEIDTKGYSSSSPTLSNAAFVSTAGSSQGNLSYQESENGSYGGYITTLSTSLGFSSSKGSSKSKCSVVDDVLYSFFANHEIDQQLVYEDLDQMNKDEFKEYDLKHQMAMLSIKVHRFEKKHGRKIKFNGRENARFDKKLVKCFNCKQMGHFSKECRAQGAQTSNNYQKYKSKEAGKYGSDLKAMVVVDEGEVVSADAILSADVSISTGLVAAAAAVSPQSETEFALMGLSTEAKWNNSGKNLYKLIDNFMSVRTKRGLRLDKYIGEGELGIDDFKFSIFHTNSDELEGQPIYNRFASVDHMKVVPPPLTGNYMPPSNIPDIDESQMVYGKKATDSSKIKTNDDSISYSNDSILFDFSDRSSKPSTNDLQTCDSSMECSRPNHSDQDSTDSISSVSTPASESRYTIVIDRDRQEDFTSVCTIETDVKSSKTLCNKFGSFNKESHFKKHKSVASKSCYVCGSYLLLIKDCDLHEQRFTKNAEGKVSAGQPNPVSAGQQNPVSAGQPNPGSAGKATLACNRISLSVSAGDGVLGPRPLNIQPKSTYFHSFTHNNQQIIFPITHNLLYSLYMTGGLNGKTTVKPSAVLLQCLCVLLLFLLIDIPFLLARVMFLLVDQLVDSIFSVSTPRNTLSAGQPYPVFAGQPNPVSAGQPNPVSAGQQNTVSAGSRNPVYAGQPNPVSAVGWPWIKSSMSTTKGSKINGGSKSKSWSFAKGLLGRPKMEKAKDRGIVDSGFSRSMSGNKDKLEDFEHFDGGEVTFGGSTGISRKGTIKTKTLNFVNVLYVEELQHFNLILVSQICDQTHRVLFTKNECLVLSKDFPPPDPSMVILSIPRKHNLYTFSLNELAPQDFLTIVENQFNHKVKTIRYDNGTEFKNANLIEFYGSKGIRRDYSNARTPQQNGVAKRKNRTLIEAVRTMLPDSFLPTIFWTEAVATACYVLNRVLVTKPHAKTPYELLTGDKPSISYLKPFGCYVTILNTSESLGKFDKKSDEGSQEDDLDSDDAPDVLIIHSTPTPKVPIIDEASIQHDGTKSDHAPTNEDNLDEFTELLSLKR
nr:ribonuclease H-like domain-containing protein [Tanacetum cinerariifolium]